MYAYKKITPTRSDKTVKTRVCLLQSRADSPKPVQENRRRRRRRRGEKVFKDSARRRGNRRKTSCLRKKIYDKSHHATKLRTNGVRKSHRRTRVKNERDSARRRILRKILRIKTEGRERVRMRSRRIWERKGRREPRRRTGEDEGIGSEAKGWKREGAEGRATERAGNARASGTPKEPRNPKELPGAHKRSPKRKGK